MEQPLSLLLNRESGMVYRLKKSPYGLKLSLSACFSCSTDIVIDFWLTRIRLLIILFSGDRLKQAEYLINVNIDDIIVTEDDNKEFLS